MLSLFIAAFLTFVSFAQTRSPWFEIQKIVIQADLTTNRKEQKQLANRALELANRCLEQNPKEAGCFYYRGQAKGLLARNVVFGYPSKVRSMLADWKQAMELDPRFDYGGPYRMFAEVFTSLPKGFGPKDLRQDLQRAVQYLEKAIEISSYPTNFLDMAEALTKEKKYNEAKQFLFKAKQTLTEWKNHAYYQSWLATLKELEEKLK